MNDLNIFFMPIFAFGVVMMLYALWCDRHELLKPVEVKPNQPTAIVEQFRMRKKSESPRRNVA